MKKKLFLIICIMFVLVPFAMAMDCPVQDGADAVFNNVSLVELEAAGFDPDRDMYVVHRDNGWLLFKLNQANVSNTLVSRSKVNVEDVGDGYVNLRVSKIGNRPFDIVQFPVDGDHESRNYFIKEALFPIDSIPNQGRVKASCINNDGTGPLFQVGGHQQAQQETSK